MDLKEALKKEYNNLMWITTEGCSKLEIKEFLYKYGIEIKEGSTLLQLICNEVLKVNVRDCFVEQRNCIRKVYNLKQFLDNKDMNIHKKNLEILLNIIGTSAMAVTSYCAEERYFQLFEEYFGIDTKNTIIVIERDTQDSITFNSVQKSKYSPLSIKYCIDRFEDYLTRVNSEVEMCNIKENLPKEKMDKKEIKVFKDYEYKGRVIKLCVVGRTKGIISQIKAAYAVKRIEDSRNDKVAQDIAYSRIDNPRKSTSLQIDVDNYTISTSLLNKFLLLTIADNLFHKIKHGEIVIRGIEENYKKEISNKGSFKTMVESKITDENESDTGNNS
jgi:hypothetical protein